LELHVRLISLSYRDYYSCDRSTTRLRATSLDAFRPAELDLSFHAICIRMHSLHKGCGTRVCLHFEMTRYYCRTKRNDCIIASQVPLIRHFQFLSWYLIFIAIFCKLNSQFYACDNSRNEIQKFINEYTYLKTST